MLKELDHHHSARVRQANGSAGRKIQLHLVFLALKLFSISAPCCNCCMQEACHAWMVSILTLNGIPEPGLDELPAVPELNHNQCVSSRSRIQSCQQNSDKLESVTIQTRLPADNTVGAALALPPI